MPKPIVPINDTTYEVEMPSGDKVEIGDKKSVDFKPHIKLNRWDGECFIKVGLPTTEKPKPVVEGDKVKFKGKDFEAHFYPFESTIVVAKDKEGRDVEFTQNELGGFEFEIILKKKPAKNEIVLGIETQGLKFYPQPYEIPEDSVAPENVKGSIAVYHATRTSFHNNKTDAEKYKCGKAFHIYRPKVTDAVGNWIWADLAIDEAKGTLTTTIPQEFLDSAVYPVSTGTTNFGYETIGALDIDLLNDLNNFIRGTAYSLSEAGTGVSLTAVLVVWESGETVEYAIYKKSDDSLVAVTGENSDGGADGWNTLNLSTSPDLTAQDYVLCARGESLARWKLFKISYDDVSVYRYGKTAVGLPGIDSFPDPFDGTKGTANFKYSIYCTYTAAPAGWTGKISGVTNPAKIAGVAVANIAKVKGVA